MKDEEERGKTEKKRGDLAKKFMLKWVEKKNNGSEGRTKFDIPKVNFNFLKNEVSSKSHSCENSYFINYPLFVQSNDTSVQVNNVVLMS